MLRGWHFCSFLGQQTCATHPRWINTDNFYLYLLLQALVTGYDLPHHATTRTAATAAGTSSTNNPPTNNTPSLLTTTTTNAHALSPNSHAHHHAHHHHLTSSDKSPSLHSNKQEDMNDAASSSSSSSSSSSLISSDSDTGRTESTFTSAKKKSHFTARGQNRSQSNGLQRLRSRDPLVEPSHDPPAESHDQGTTNDDDDYTQRIRYPNHSRILVQPLHDDERALQSRDLERPTAPAQEAKKGQKQRSSSPVYFDRSRFNPYRVQLPLDTATQGKKQGTNNKIIHL